MCDFWVKKCSASVGLSIPVRTVCPETLQQHCMFFTLPPPTVFQDSGIPDSFPVYHYNGLKQSNHNERVRHSSHSGLFIAADGGGSV